MAASRPFGTLYTIEWSGYDDRRPADWPRVLAELFVIGRMSVIPAEIAEFPHTMGSGYSLTIRHVPYPLQPMPAERLASIRRKRLERRMRAKYPLFAEQLVVETMAKDPGYYRGVTDPRIDGPRQAVLERERQEYEELMTRPGVLIVHAAEPDGARERGEALWREMASVRERLARKREEA